MKCDSVEVVVASAVAVGLVVRPVVVVVELVQCASAGECECSVELPTQKARRHSPAGGVMNVENRDYDYGLTA